MLSCKMNSNRGNCGPRSPRSEELQGVHLCTDTPTADDRRWNILEDFGQCDITEHDGMMG